MINSCKKDDFKNMPLREYITSNWFFMEALFIEDLNDSMEIVDGEYAMYKNIDFFNFILTSEISYRKITFSDLPNNECGIKCYSDRKSSENVILIKDDEKSIIWKADDGNGSPIRMEISRVGKDVRFKAFHPQYTNDYLLKLDDENKLNEMKSERNNIKCSCSTW